MAVYSHFTTVIVILTAVIFGIVPGIQTSKPDLVNSLKDSGRSGTESFMRQRLRRGLVTLQIALALVLLIGAGLMINSFVRVQNKDLGADQRRVDIRFSLAAGRNHQAVWPETPVSACGMSAR